MPSRSPVNVCRKSTPGIAAAVGTAVCLSGGNAVATSGNVAASNAGNSAFGNNVAINLFNSLAKVSFFDHGQDFHAHFKGIFGSLQGAVNDTFSNSLLYLAAGVTVKGTMPFGPSPYMNGNQSNKYIGVRFNSGGTKYGWVHLVSSDAGANNVTIDTWAYDQTGGTIKTLDESIIPKKLPLSDGRVKLNWSNANEAGVARYEVQVKGGDGAWAAVDSSVPGEGRYASTVQAGEYRLMVENSDGTSRSVAF